MQFTKEPAYVKLYFDCLGVYIKNDGLNESLNDMLLEVLKLGNYADEEQTVTLVAYQKEKICKKTGKSMARLEQAITTWVKNKILIRIARGTYRINPWIFGKGEWRDISNLRANFDFKNGQVTVEREYKQEKVKEKTPPDAPESPETHEKTGAGENVPAEEEKAENESKITEMEKKVELPPLDPCNNLDIVVSSAYKCRDNFFQQFNEQISLFENPEFSEKMTAIFQTELSADFWSKTWNKTLENLLSYHDEWQVEQKRKN